MNKTLLYVGLAAAGAYLLFGRKKPKLPTEDGDISETSTGGGGGGGATSGATNPLIILQGLGTTAQNILSKPAFGKVVRKRPPVQSGTQSRG